VTFEGGDGTGKTTQLRRLAARLRAAGRDVVETREPGGSPGAEEIRRLLLEGDPGRWSPVTELLLFNAARRDHVERVIAPALEAGHVVLCDRFADSTRVYQGTVREAPASDRGASAGAVVFPPPAGRAMADALHALVIGREPDLTLILDADPARALARGFERGGQELRFERMGLPFHEAVRARFLALAEANPARCRLVDASGDPDAVERRVRKAVSDRLPEAL
jgi:dTMP kinase